MGYVCSITEITMKMFTKMLEHKIKPIEERKQLAQYKVHDNYAKYQICVWILVYKTFSCLKKYKENWN